MDKRASLAVGYGSLNNTYFGGKQGVPASRGFNSHGFSSPISLERLIFNFLEDVWWLKIFKWISKIAGFFYKSFLIKKGFDKVSARRLSVGTEFLLIPKNPIKMSDLKLLSFYYQLTHKKNERKSSSHSNEKKFTKINRSNIKIVIPLSKLKISLLNSNNFKSFVGHLDDSRIISPSTLTVFQLIIRIHHRQLQMDVIGMKVHSWCNDEISHSRD